MPFSYTNQGFCPICQKPVQFHSQHTWYRDHLSCPLCESVPRERALAFVLEEKFPNWRTLTIHESSPVYRGISKKLAEETTSYLASQYYPNNPLGDTVNGFKNENLEKQTFPDQTFDLVISLDVMEHVNDPEAVFKEVRRTLRPGGAYLFSAPTEKYRILTKRVARYREDGTTEHYETPEYHGNPIDHEGSLVTFRYGYDLPELIYTWSGMNTRIFRFHDHDHGIIGDMTEIYLCEAPQNGLP